MMVRFFGSIAIGLFALGFGIIAGVWAIIHFVF